MQQLTIINPTKSIHGGFITRKGKKPESVRFMPGANLVAKETWDLYVAMAGGAVEPLRVEAAPMKAPEALRFIAESVDESALSLLSTHESPAVVKAAAERLAEITPEKKSAVRKS